MPIFDLCDTPDWISQVLLEAFLEAPNPASMLLWQGKRLPTLSVVMHRQLQNYLRKRKDDPTKGRRVHGSLLQLSRQFFLEISVDGDGLHMAPQGHGIAAYKFYHYHHDFFAWDCDRDAESKETLYPQYAI